MPRTKLERVNEHRIKMIAHDIGIDSGSLTSLMLDLFELSMKDGGYRMWLQRAYENSDGELIIEGRFHQMRADEWNDIPEGTTKVISYDDPEADP